MNNIDILEEKEAINWLSALDVKSEYEATNKEIILSLIETLISENKELKEKNKELEESLKFQKKLTKIAQIITDESLKEALEEIEKDYIPKSKVEEEIRKAINNEIDLSKAMFEGDFTNGYIYALQSLLGKE